MEEVPINTTEAKAKQYEDMMAGFNQKYGRKSRFRKSDIQAFCNDLMIATGEKWRVVWDYEAFEVYRVRMVRIQDVDESDDDESADSLSSSERRGRLRNRVRNGEANGHPNEGAGQFDDDLADDEPVERYIARRRLRNRDVTEEANEQFDEGAGQSDDEPVDIERIMENVLTERRGRLRNRVGAGEASGHFDEGAGQSNDDLITRNVLSQRRGRLRNRVVIGESSGQQNGETNGHANGQQNGEANGQQNGEANGQPNEQLDGDIRVLFAQRDVRIQYQRRRTRVLDGASSPFDTRVPFAQRDVRMQYQRKKTLMIMRNCKYNSLGCTENQPFLSISEHEETCPYSLCGCPCNNAVSNCSFGGGKISDLVQHLKTVHNAEVELRLDFTRTYLLSGSLADNPTFMPTVIESNEHLFYLHFESSNGSHMACILSLNEDTTAEKYFYQLQVNGSTEEIIWNAVIRNVRNYGNVKASDDWLVIPHNLALLFAGAQPGCNSFSLQFKGYIREGDLSSLA